MLLAILIDGGSFTVLPIVDKGAQEHRAARVSHTEAAMLEVVFPVALVAASIRLDESAVTAPATVIDLAVVVVSVGILYSVSVIVIYLPIS